jgi:hypothetical protein
MPMTQLELSLYCAKKKILGTQDHPIFKLSTEQKHGLLG